MKYEMRIPPGVPGQVLATVMEEYNLEIMQSEDGPILQGEKENLENAQDVIIKALNERIQELEGKK
ncbi:hypothetical protein [Methanobacterium sp. ACI-7]|uniref:hypothetical protein n=1 Tax=unclassified Methanobacterium TaxID=2627676 RepID=UPI0039C0FCAF